MFHSSQKNLAEIKKYAAVNLIQLYEDQALRQKFQTWFQSYYSSSLKDHLDCSTQLSIIQNLNQQLVSRLQEIERNLLANETLAVFKKQSPEQTKQFIVEYLKSANLTDVVAIRKGVLSAAFNKRENLLKASENFDRLKIQYNLLVDREFYTYPDAHLLAKFVAQGKKEGKKGNELHYAAAISTINKLLSLISLEKDPHQGKGLNKNEIDFLKSLTSQEQQQALPRILQYRSKKQKQDKTPQQEEQKDAKPDPEVQKKLHSKVEEFNSAIPSISISVVEADEKEKPVSSEGTSETSYKEKLMESLKKIFFLLIIGAIVTFGIMSFCIVYFEQLGLLEVGATFFLQFTVVFLTVVSSFLVMKTLYDLIILCFKKEETSSSSQTTETMEDTQGEKNIYGSQRSFIPLGPVYKLRTSLMQAEAVGALEPERTNEAMKKQARPI